MDTFCKTVADQRRRGFTVRNRLFRRVSAQRPAATVQPGSRSGCRLVCREQPDVSRRPLCRWACVSPLLRSFLRRVVREASRGGRRSGDLVTRVLGRCDSVAGRRNDIRSLHRRRCAARGYRVARRRTLRGREQLLCVRRIWSAERDRDDRGCTGHFEDRCVSAMARLGRCSDCGRRLPGICGHRGERPRRRLRDRKPPRVALIFPVGRRTVRVAGAVARCPGQGVVMTTLFGFRATSLIARPSASRPRFAGLRRAWACTNGYAAGGISPSRSSSAASFAPSGGLCRWRADVLCRLERSPQSGKTGAHRTNRLGSPWQTTRFGRLRASRRISVGALRKAAFERRRPSGGAPRDSNANL